MCGISDCQVGLARTRRAEAEHEVRTLKRPNVRALQGGTRLYHATARADLSLTVCTLGVLIRVADEAVKVPGTDLFTAGYTSVKLLEDPAGDFATGFGAGENHDVAVS